MTFEITTGIISHTKFKEKSGYSEKQFDYNIDYIGANLKVEKYNPNPYG